MSLNEWLSVPWIHVKLCMSHAVLLVLELVGIIVIFSLRYLTVLAWGVATLMGSRRHWRHAIDW